MSHFTILNLAHILAQASGKFHAVEPTTYWILIRAAFRIRFNSQRMFLFGVLRNRNRNFFSQRNRNRNKIIPQKLSQTQYKIVYLIPSFNKFQGNNADSITKKARFFLQKDFFLKTASYGLHTGLNRNRNHNLSKVLPGTGTGTVINSCGSATLPNRAYFKFSRHMLLGLIIYQKKNF